MAGVQCPEGVPLVLRARLLGAAQRILGAEVWQFLFFLWLGCSSPPILAASKDGFSTVGEVASGESEAQTVGDLV